MKRRYALLFIMVMALFGCDYLPFGYTEIKDIAQNPAAYEGKEIRIRGTVSNVVKIPFVEIKMYSIKDNGAEIAVITDGPLPAENQQIAIKAQVNNTAIIGGQSIGLKLREIKRL
jgi:hypothetical protein